MPLDEKQLIKGCLKGDRHAQESLYQQFASQMYVVCLRYTKAQQEAEDVLQESFIKVYKQLKNFKGNSSLFFWIKRIVINTALNHQRSKLYLYPMVDIEDLSQTRTTPTNLSEYSMDELLQMIKELPQSSQVIFNLYAIEGYKHREIAEMLEINEGTSKSQYARAKQLLQDKMQETKKNYGRG
ncbi:RNA polymerase sigma factor [Reichenbachiella agariperforans]|uniref:RNA polymerase sigma-70 factor, ECF subfamily n=1 Tax=Reichenbachiella agariperforans TaxID=156994 RepID=A0A1M6WCM6_REIAG|nr:RNA polymerase sigma factor [Reichenbachiella agariperforans]MBU2915158.1 RNA polymerase sigma factor [Reichenbachiella agariperforans]SHK91336.1 RNA polymerase sigma-70 factor, ECF subfamily [Reichenbachiella agariperforans]